MRACARLSCSRCACSSACCAFSRASRRPALPCDSRPVAGTIPSRDDSDTQAHHYGHGHHGRRIRTAPGGAAELDDLPALPRADWTTWPRPRSSDSNVDSNAVAQRGRGSWCSIGAGAGPDAISSLAQPGSAGALSGSGSRAGWHWRTPLPVVGIITTGRLAYAAVRGRVTAPGPGSRYARGLRERAAVLPFSILLCLGLLAPHVTQALAAPV
jgi:hypothetical protein